MTAARISKGDFFQMDDCRCLPLPTAKIPIICAAQSDAERWFSGSVTVFGGGVAVEGGRAARPRPCGWEPLAGLATVPAALVLAGSAFAAMAIPAKNAAPRTVDLQRVSISHLLAFPPP
jgi:hypothetical protein